MYSKTIFGLMGLCLAFSACKKELQPQDSSPALNAEAATTTPTASAAQPSVQPIPGPAPSQPATQAAAVAPGMNPAHGQPNHRCDIAVGAPLNSPPAKAPAANTASPAAKPAMTINPMPMNAKGSPAAPVVTAPGMNPPHGEPGHRCDIAVGQPLASAPAAATAQPAAAPAPQSQFTVSEPQKAAAGKTE